MHTKLTSRPLSWLLILSSVVATQALAQHVHGVIAIGVVLEEQALAVTFTAPLSDVVGFEHAPQNEEQKQLLRMAASKLENADAMFGPTSAADCKIQSASVSGPSYLEEFLKVHATDADEHEAGEHDEHSDHHEAEHAEVVASYEWTCNNATELKALALHFTEHFQNVESIDVQILTAAGARLESLRGRAASVSLSQQQ